MWLIYQAQVRKNKRVQENLEMLQDRLSLCLVSRSCDSLKGPIKSDNTRTARARIQESHQKSSTPANDNDNNLN